MVIGSKRFFFVLAYVSTETAYLTFASVLFEV